MIICCVWCGASRFPASTKGWQVPYTIFVLHWDIFLQTCIQIYYAWWMVNQIFPYRSHQSWGGKYKVVMICRQPLAWNANRVETLKSLWYALLMKNAAGIHWIFLAIHSLQMRLSHFQHVTESENFKDARGNCLCYDCTLHKRRAITALSNKINK